MSSQRVNFDTRLKQAARAFWRGRDQAAEKQQAAGKLDQGNRGRVTGGKALDSFRDMVVEVVKRHGPKGVSVHRDRAVVGLPGYFRPTKLWDLLVMHEGRLLAVLELKSLCGPSFGNNANNRCEEALGSGYDFRKAQSEGLFGGGAAPFLGYFILVENDAGSRTPIRDRSPHFPADIVFQKSSYQSRMKLMCERMVQHQIYACASVLVATGGAAAGECTNLSAQTSFRNLLTKLAAHLASEADMLSHGSVFEAQAPYGLGLDLDGAFFEPVEQPVTGS
jgi:hypothetical protein